MKTLKILFISFLFIAIAQTGFAQTKTEKFKVAGECGMCKKKIEKAAKQAGATNAVWNTESKMLAVSYNTNSTDQVKIQQAIAAIGYDTPKFKATEEAYSNLHECCKYDRSLSKSEAKSCCDHEKCTTAACAKDGKCSKDMSCCKEAGCDKKDCCKKA